MTTHSPHDDGTGPEREPDDTERRDVAGPPAQGSGKQFERGTRADGEDHDTAAVDEPAVTEPGAGPGSSASGKQFARGTDSGGSGREST